MQAPTLNEMAAAYVKTIRNEREHLIKQINEASNKVSELDKHVAECEAVLNPPAPAIPAEV